MIGGAPLNRQGNLLPGIGIRLVLKVGLNFFELHRLLVGNGVGQLVDQVALGLLSGQAGDALQHLQLAALHGVQLFLLRVQLSELGGHQFLFFLQVFCLTVQVFLFLVQAVLLALKLTAAVLDLFVKLRALFENLLLGFYGSLPLLVFGTLDGVVDDTPRLFLRRANLPLGEGFPPLIAGNNAYDQTDHACRHRNENCCINGQHWLPHLLSLWFFSQNSKIRRDAPKGTPR